VRKVQNLNSLYCITVPLCPSEYLLTIRIDKIKEGKVATPLNGKASLWTLHACKVFALESCKNKFHFPIDVLYSVQKTQKWQKMSQTCHENRQRIKCVSS